MLDIVFCSLPYSDLDHVYNAPAILKGVVVDKGFTAKTIDFGCSLLNQCNRDVNYFIKTQSYFISPIEINYEIEKFYNNCIEYFKQNPSKYIAISVFSIYTHRATFELCKKIKEQNIQSKIVIGGRGCKHLVFSSIEPKLSLTSKDKLISFGELMKLKKLVNEYIIGDGEDAILEVLEKGLLPKFGMNNNYISERFKYPIPNYDDYNFNDYLFSDGKVMLPITGSKGCVRDCDFCDVNSQFGKYRYRTGKDIANELISISNKFGIRKFQFTDSLVNGGLRPFLEFLTIIKEYNLSNPDKKIKWNGQYICRPAYQIPAGIYELMADAGAEGLTIGAESGSNNVLKSIGKKTTVEALFEELEQFRKYNITCYILTFVGHWDETWDDFIAHCKMIINLVPYVRSGTISAVAVGPVAMMLHGTPAFENKDNRGIILSEFDNIFIWHNKNNQDNTFKERIYRRLIVYELCKRLKIPSGEDYEVFTLLKNIIDSKFENINGFYNRQVKTSF